jgi:UDP-3-O-[3-hydroxymyristoyl] glucosamine N-acyltransferase
MEMIGGRNCGTFDHGNNVRIQAQSGVGRNVKDDEVLQGSPTDIMITVSLRTL